MTREELCGLLGLPPETPPAELIQARARRLAEIDFALREEDLPKPVKLKLHQEVGLLEPVHDLIAELEVISHIEAYLAEIAAEFAKPNAVRGVVRLCLSKLKPLVPEVKDEATRFGFEKQVIEIEERIGGLVEPVEPPPVSGGTRERIEGYFTEIAAELAKPDPGRGVVRLCLGKLKPLVDEIQDETVRYGYEKRLVQIEDRMGLRVSTAPFLFAKGRTPPAAKPEGGGGLEPGPAARAEPKPPAPPAPAGPTPGPARGTLLELSPVRGEGTLRQPGPPIHFVARPRFVLGRRRASVDFATAFLPENDENHRKNETISRINTTFFVKDSQIWVQDGELQADGKVKPSTNGTVVDGQQITAAKALSFTKERRLKVGQHNYELAVLQLPAAAPEGPPLAAAGGTLSTQPTQVASRGPAGCLRFLATGREVGVMAVWLFTDAALGSDPQSAVRLEPAGLPPVAARFHHWQGGFWLEAPPGGKSAVMLDERRLAAGEVVPLRAAHVLRLGELSYDVRVS
jgi:hypothetical protein